ncbi:MAG: protease [Nitrospirales bacterium]|nr:MAG: protease [Nitrospirales bacterium]
MHTRTSRFSNIVVLCFLLLSGASCATSPSASSVQSETNRGDSASQNTTEDISDQFDRLRAKGLQDQDTINLDALEPGEVCVINVNEDEAKKLDTYASSRGYTKKKRRILNGLGFVMSILHVPPGHTVQQGIGDLRKAFPSQIIDANHHYFLQGKTVPIDPRLYGHRLVKWNEQTANCTTQDISIGMIDTPVDRHRLPLHHRPIHMESFLSEHASKASDHHGTAVAILLVGQAQSTRHALLPQASLFVAEAFRQTDKGHTEATTWSIVRALDWLVERKVQIINLSLGGPPNALLSFAIQNTLAEGIPIVAAGGNVGPRGQSIYPAAQPGVLAVTALDVNLHPYQHASRGPYIAFSAPGVDIWIPKNSHDGVFQSGTSFAAPFVTTAAATVKQLHPNWTPEQVTHHLASHALDLGQLGKDNTFGWGLIQIPQTCPPSGSLTQTPF